MALAETLTLEGVDRRRTVMGRAAVILGLLVYTALLGAAWWAVVQLVPDQLTLQALGKTKVVGDVHNRIVTGIGLLAAILPASLWIECLAVGWQRSSARALMFGPTLSMRTDLAVLVLGQSHVLDLVGKVMLLGASMISSLAIRDWIQAKTGFAVDPTGLPLALQVVIYFFVYTFFDYWTHRLDHTRFFWPIHRYHHSAEDFCVVTSARQHPAAFSAIFVINLPLAILGATPAVMIFVSVVVTTVGFLIHSQLQSDWGWIGRWVIQSPLHHRLHHKLDMTHPTGHFAMAPIWDRLFGTWYGGAQRDLVIGVSQPYRHGFWIVPDLLRDYWHFWSGFVVRRYD